jgi:protein O-mannosyl-transferase
VYPVYTRKLAHGKSQPLIPQTPSRKLPPLTPHFALGALAFAVYANSLASGFITDDQFQILNNPVVTGAQNLGSAFGSGVWAFLGYRGNYFRPLQFAIYGLIYRAFGPSAFAFHLLMVLLHAVNTALVYSLARRLFARRPPAAAWVAAALFALHPIHTEAVNWIAALPDVLVTSFALAGLLAFAAQEAAPNAWQRVLHCAIYFAALLTKETGVVLPALYAGYQWLRVKRENVPMYAGMAGAFALYLALRINALGGFAPAQHTFFQLSGMEFAMSAVALLARYFAALVWPLGLNFFHVFHATKGASWQLMVSLAALAALAWAAVRFGSRDRVAVFAGLWMVFSIAPALDITGVGQNVFAERYLYLPSVGFVILAGLFWVRLADARASWAWPTALAILLVLSMETIARNRDWKDDFTLLQVTLSQSPDAGYVHNLMAGAWVQRDQFQRALEEESLAVSLEPRSAVFHKNLGNILLGMDPAAAAREFAAAIAIQPGSAELHRDLGLAYKATGEAEKAAQEFARAAAIDKSK